MRKTPAMAEKKVTCVICPVGCEGIVAGTEEAVIAASGFQCKKGKVYAQDEYLNPRRIFTSTAKLKNSDCAVFPVRSDAPVPRKLLFECMKIVRDVVVVAPVKRGQIIVKDIAGSGVNIVASAQVEIHGESKGHRHP
jgi:CxxC motif-containing protein